jgi:hypothetical protein
MASSLRQTAEETFLFTCPLCQRVGGECVTYDTAEGERGTHATNVRLVTGRDAEIERSYAAHKPVRLGD